MKFLEPNQYQDDCEKLFQQYRASIVTVLPNARIEHIGASSIHGAISKGDLDIYVQVPADDLDEAVREITKLGFVEKADTLRTPELCMLEAQSSDDVAVQLVASGSKFEFFLHFRDALNSDKALVEQYNQLKRSFEGRSQASYRASKSKFVERALASLQPKNPGDKTSRAARELACFAPDLWS